MCRRLFLPPNRAPERSWAPFGSSCSMVRWCQRSVPALAREPVQASRSRRINSLRVTVVLALFPWAGLGGGRIVVELLSGESMKLLVLSQRTPSAVSSRSSCSRDFRSVELGEGVWGKALIGPRSVGHDGVFSARSQRRSFVGGGWLSRSGSRTSEIPLGSKSSLFCLEPCGD